VITASQKRALRLLALGPLTRARCAWEWRTTDGDLVALPTGKALRKRGFVKVFKSDERLTMRLTDAGRAVAAVNQ
jgi:hypothetical protein